MASLTLTTTPAGAEIFLNGLSTGKKTPMTIEVARGSVSAIEFRLKGYENLFLKEIKIDSDKLAKDGALKKLASSSTTTHTHTTTKTPKACDTCLERPD